MRELYRELFEKRGYEGAELEQVVEDAMEYQRRDREREYREFPGKPEWIADKLLHLVGTSTARYSDLPPRSPLPAISDVEWRQALAIVQRHREAHAAKRVDNFVRSSSAKNAHHELTYLLRHHEYAPVDRLPYYVELLRKAQRNYTTIADAFEAERQRMAEQETKEVRA